MNFSMQDCNQGKSQVFGSGLNYWDNMPPYGNGTAGYAWIKNMEGQYVKNFQGDFGSEISQSFTVGMTIDIPDLNPEGYFNVFPNPSGGNFTLSAILKQPDDSHYPKRNAN